MGNAPSTNILIKQILDTLQTFTKEMIETRKELNELHRDVTELKLTCAKHIDETLPYKCIVHSA